MMNNIYKRIEFLIASKNMTKKAFCMELNISIGNFGDWKRGESNPSASKLIDIAHYFNVSLDWLMTGKEHHEKLNESLSVNESNIHYFFDQKGQLNCRLEDLPEDEQKFIKEYLQFTQYRKMRASNIE